jgi:hypothetical protein
VGWYYSPDFAVQEGDVVEVSVDAMSLEEAEERHQVTIKAKEGEIETLQTNCSGVEKKLADAEGLLMQADAKASIVILFDVQEQFAKLRSTEPFRSSAKLDITKVRLVVKTLEDRMEEGSSTHAANVSLLEKLQAELDLVDETKINLQKEFGVLRAVKSVVCTTQDEHDKVKVSSVSCVTSVWVMTIR